MASLGKVDMAEELKNHPFGIGCILLVPRPPMVSAIAEQEGGNKAITCEKNPSAGEPK